MAWRNKIKQIKTCKKDQCIKKDKKLWNGKSNTLKITSIDIF